MTLDQCKIHHQYIIKNIAASTKTYRHLQHLGFWENTIIQCLYTAPAKTPVAFLVQGSVIALRRNDLKRIHVQEVV